MGYDLKPLAIPFCSRDFDVFHLQVESKALKNNPLGDSHVRANYVLALGPRARTRWFFIFRGFLEPAISPLILKLWKKLFPNV